MGTYSFLIDLDADLESSSLFLRLVRTIAGEGEERGGGVGVGVLCPSSLTPEEEATEGGDGDTKEEDEVAAAVAGGAERFLDALFRTVMSRSISSKCCSM